MYALGRVITPMIRLGYAGSFLRSQSDSPFVVQEELTQYQFKFMELLSKV